MMLCSLSLSFFLSQLGSKETSVMQAVMETEDEASQTLPEDMSLSDVYEPIRVGRWMGR